jgi:glutamate/tyrosine decarboxylase-like PLP-dependent enzyme
MAGTRPGGGIAAAWAAMMAMGQDGYLESAKRTMETTKALMDGINAIPGLYVLGTPEMSVFAFSSDEINMFALGDAMEERGWHLDRQPAPDSLHMMVTMTHDRVVDQFLADLKNAVEYVRANPSAATEGSAPMYGMMATAPDRGMVKDFVLETLDGLF